MADEPTVYARHIIANPDAPTAPATVHMHSRELREVYEICSEAIKASGWLDEYFSSSWSWEAEESARKTREIEERGFPRITDKTKLEDLPVRWIQIYPVTGGSEGHYVHVDLMWQRNYREGRVPLFLYKTFAGMEQAISVANLLIRALEP